MKKSIMLSTLIGSSLIFTACTTMQNNVESETATTSEASMSSNDSTVTSEGANVNEISKLYGNWVEKNPINDTEFQGFRLNQDLSASSINMETLQYQSWSYQDNTLSLVARSIGNKVSGVDTLTYKVISVDETTLVLDNNGQQLVFKKQQ
ncbi:lipocalin family protein [Acinetobacter rudis]|uniref:Lipocalin-like domain-containing protein n=1 Tax=Acinetobacter rudis CIP 110305 TaxID=421052 RepID=S3MXP0_9GAMM|nr:lipocalin family protein [Acinetobacter rudis]EPF72640.1 hypothetical protein F945_02134 [Acinetobacter rudis CIP 110305]